MASPFTFYVKDGLVLREITAGKMAGEVSVFEGAYDLCEYLSEVDKQLWEARELLTATNKRLDKIVDLAGKIQDS